MNNHLDTDKFIGDDDFFYTDFSIFIKTNTFSQILISLRKNMLMNYLLRRI